MKVMRAVAAVVVVVSLCGSAFAGEGEGKERRDHAERHKGRFEAADTDGSGAISLEEFKAAHDKRMAEFKERLGDRWDPERAAKRPGADEIFGKIDADGDGQATMDEFRAHGAKMRERFRGRRRRPHDGGEKKCPHGDGAKKGGDDKGSGDGA